NRGYDLPLVGHCPSPFAWRSREAAPAPFRSTPRQKPIIDRYGRVCFFWCPAASAVQRLCSAGGSCQLGSVMQIDVRQLEAFRAVMENRSVTRAAEILGISQPAVSVKLARLENELGFRLFERYRGRVKPTFEGQELYSEVKQALGMMDRVQIAAERIRSGETGTVVVASHPSASISLLPELVADFSREH